MTAVNDYTVASDDEFQELLDRIDREPEAPEAFDATAALRRVMALADELEHGDWEPGWAASPDYWAGLGDAADRIRAAVAGQP